MDAPEVAVAGDEQEIVGALNVSMRQSSSLIQMRFQPGFCLEVRPWPHCPTGPEGLKVRYFRDITKSPDRLRSPGMRLTLPAIGTVLKGGSSIAFPRRLPFDTYDPDPLCFRNRGRSGRRVDHSRALELKRSHTDASATSRQLSGSTQDDSKESAEIMRQLEEFVSTINPPHQ